MTVFDDQSLPIIHEDFYDVVRSSKLSRFQTAARRSNLHHTKVEVKADAYWNRYFLLGTPETATWYVEYQGVSPTVWRIPYTQDAADELLQLQRQNSA